MSLSYGPYSTTGRLFVKFNLVNKLFIMVFHRIYRLIFIVMTMKYPCLRMKIYYVDIKLYQYLSDFLISYICQRCLYTIDTYKAGEIWYS